MHRYTTNPPSRQIAPRPVLAPSCQPNPLLSQIESYLAASGMTAPGFGQLAAGDARLLRDMRRGHQIDDVLATKVEQFLTFAIGAQAVRHA